ncbi:heat shock protein Hsp20 [Synechococcus phage S-CAM3]|uniref:Heat shock protein Hsp20 n=1 Tax=Synechococcus phage S-CAM3 TaxID=1883366 RepID=A0A1D8KJX2_9CAUD|nr:Hsp20 heat shock protein [Synechococcus phage S-CAM3]AOV58674.1 heat shock protein Hsp20 [Synechococcus phage S-CAM3]AOV58914.1 heat shock protein Hsp20 [Synechococcus phage S-CAM3]AOV59153.1 heat shock protein Hsp20 [Synechococcus phage S-CAM3]
MSNHNTNYPPFNLIKHDNSKFTIEIALAGFKPEEIEVSTESNILKVATKDAKRDSEVQYLHRGVSKRSFVNTWQLSDDVKVGDVTFVDGLLVIYLNKYIPEHQRKIVYDISGTKELLLE